MTPRYIRVIVAFVLDEMQHQHRWTIDGNVLRHVEENIQISSGRFIRIDGYEIGHDLTPIIGPIYRTLYGALSFNATIELEKKWSTR